MATAACYLGQAATLALTVWLTGKAFAAGRQGLALALVVVFAIVAIFWDCRYTIAVVGDRNVIVCKGEDS